MWPYWVLFLIPAILALQERRPSASGPSQTLRGRRVPPSWKLFGVAVALMVGWRHEVGGDWTNYLDNFRANSELELRVIIQRGDPGYQVLEWMAHQFDWSVYGVNLVCGVVFALGLVWFCLRLPRPWLAMVVAVPYLVIVLGMGYSRQGVALACIMAGLVALGNGRVRMFVLWALLGAAFHKSAVLVLPMAALAAAKNRWWAAGWVGVISGIAYVIFVQSSLEDLRLGYIEARYQSQGAFVRLLMNAIPAAILLLFLKRFRLNLPQQRMWYWYSVFSLVAFIALYFVPSSTALDRMALYLLPLQLVVFSYLPEILGARRGANTGWVVFVVASYAAVQFVWLVYSRYAYTWIPYQFYPLTEQFWGVPR